MKNFWIIVMVAIITITLIGCGGDDTTEHVHQWGDWIETTAPTCTEAGVETRTCTLDATHKETRTGAAAIGHQWGEWAETTAPTNTADGEETRTCTHDATHKETRPLYARSFTIGGVSFVFEFSKDDTTSWTKLEPAVQNFITYITDNPDSEHARRTKELSARTGAKFRIIVDYSDEEDEEGIKGKAKGFVATDAQTLTVGSEFLATNALNPNRFRDAFIALLNKPYPIPDDSD